MARFLLQNVCLIVDRKPGSPMAYMIGLRKPWASSSLKGDTADTFVLYKDKSILLYKW